MRLTLRTLLAYLDDTLPPAEATTIGQKVAESEQTRELIEKIRKLTRKRGLASPSVNIDDPASNPNTVAEYLSDTLSSDMVTEFEQACLDTEINLAEVSACHQILTLLLSEPARVPPTARKRMYELVKGPESLPNRKPGLTIPVGGMPAEKPVRDPYEDDPGLLQGHSPASFGIRGVIAAGLLIAMLVATWLAWPAAFQQPKPAAGVELAEANPNEVKPPVVADKDQEKDKEKKAEADAEKGKQTDVNKEKDKVKDAEKGTKPEQPTKGTPTDDTTKEKPGTKPMPMPTPEKPVEPAKVDPYLIDTSIKPIGTLVSKDQVLLTSSGPNTWTRIADAAPVNAGERLLCLPGYKAKVQLESKVMVILWGNVPDQLPLGPLESSVTLNVPPSKLDADLTLNTGRIYLQTVDPKGATVRVRMNDQIADIRIPDDKTEVAAELMYMNTKGLRPNVIISKHEAWSLATARGSVQVTWKSQKTPVQLAANEGVDSLGNTPAVVAKHLERLLVYPDAVTALNAQKALAAFATSLTPTDRVNVKLAEASNGESPARARIAIFGQAAIGNVSEIADDLLDAKRPLVRDAALIALRSAIAIDPSRIDTIAKTLQTKLGVTPAQSQWIMALLRGPDEQELKSRETLNRLVDGLTADSLPERELSHRTLLLDYDPDALKVPGLLRYDPTGPVEDREACQKMWRKRIEDRTK